MKHDENQLIRDRVFKNFQLKEVLDKLSNLSSE